MHLQVWNYRTSQIVRRHTAVWSTLNNSGECCNLNKEQDGEFPRERGRDAWDEVKEKKEEEQACQLDEI